MISLSPSVEHKISPWSDTGKGLASAELGAVLFSQSLQRKTLSGEAKKSGRMWVGRGDGKEHSGRVNHERVIF